MRKEGKLDKHAAARTTTGNEKVSKKREKMNQMKYLEIIKAQQEVERQRLAETRRCSPANYHQSLKHEGERLKPVRKRFHNLSADILLPDKFNPHCVSTENKSLLRSSKIKTGYQSEILSNPRRPLSAPAGLRHYDSRQMVTPTPHDNRRDVTPIYRAGVQVPHIIIIDPPTSASGENRPHVYKEKTPCSQRRSSRPDEVDVYPVSGRRRRNSDCAAYTSNTKGSDCGRYTANMSGSYTQLCKNASCSELYENHNSATQRTTQPLLRENVVDLGTFISKKLSEWKLNKANRNCQDKFTSPKAGSEENVELKDVKPISSPMTSSSSRKMSGSISKCLKNGMAKRKKKTRTPLVEALKWESPGEQNEIIYGQLDKSTDDVVEYRSSQFLY